MAQQQTHTPAHQRGRKANEDGIGEKANPFAPGTIEHSEWWAGWSDAQIDREIWEDENRDRAIMCGAA